MTPTFSGLAVEEQEPPSDTIWPATALFFGTLGAVSLACSAFGGYGWNIDGDPPPFVLRSCSNFGGSITILGFLSLFNLTWSLFMIVTGPVLVFALFRKTAKLSVAVGFGGSITLIGIIHFATISNLVPPILELLGVGLGVSVVAVLILRYGEWSKPG